MEPETLSVQKRISSQIDWVNSENVLYCQQKPQMPIGGAHSMGDLHMYEGSIDV